MAKKIKPKVRVITSVTINELKILDATAEENELTRSQYLRELIRRSNSQQKRKGAA